MPTIDKSSLASSYDKTMKEMQQKLSTPERIWSNIIHAQPSVVIGIVVGLFVRPRSLLFGGIFATIALGVLYLLSRLHGVTLNGAEPLIAFMFGWATGLLYDLFYIAGKNHLR